MELFLNRPHILKCLPCVTMCMRCVCVCVCVYMYLICMRYVCVGVNVMWVWFGLQGSTSQAAPGDSIRHSSWCL